MSGFFISFEAITNYDLSACFENFPTKRSGKRIFLNWLRVKHLRSEIRTNFEIQNVKFHQIQWIIVAANVLDIVPRNRFVYGVGVGVVVSGCF